MAEAKFYRNEGHEIYFIVACIDNSIVFLDLPYFCNEKPGRFKATGLIRGFCYS